MNRLNYYSLLIFVHIFLLFSTIIGSIYVVGIGKPEWLIAFITIPLINLLIIPLTRKTEKFDPTHPILMILVSLIIGTVLRSFFILSPYESDAKFLMLLGKPPSILMLGIIAIYTGVIFFVFGYLFPTKSLPKWSNMRLFKNDVSLKKFIPFAVVLTAISMVCALIYFEKVGVNFSDVTSISQKRRFKLEGGEGYAVLGYYRVTMDLIEPLYYILLIYVLQYKRKIFSLLGMFLIFLGLLNVIYPFIESSRTNALYILINTGLIIYFLKKTIKWRQIIYVTVSACILLIIMSALREKHSVVRSKTEAEVNPLVIMVGSLNFLGVDKTSQIIDRMPEKLDFQLGETFLLWLVAPVPRTLWTSKPEISYGLVVGEKIYEKRDESSMAGGVPPGYVAELYINFGYIGIIFGMFLLGIVTKLYYNAFLKVRSNSTYALLLYIQVFIPFSLKLIGGDFSGVIVKVIIGIVTITAIMKFIQIRSSTTFQNE